MRWIGATVGAIVGGARGGGLLGSFVGALVGGWLENQVRRAMPQGGAHRHHHRTEPPPMADDEDDPYEVLGVPRSATPAEIKAAYREKARRLHPDALRSKGLPDELVAEANRQMARVNAAWSRIGRP